MPQGRPAPTANHLLASLPPDQYRRLLPDLEPVELGVGECLQQAGQVQSHVLFPCSGVLSLNYQMEDGSSVAVGLVGQDGLLGICLFMEGAPPSSRALVQTSGYGFKLGSGALAREFRAGGQLQNLGLRYIQALITQMAQTAVCNRHHSLDQQICRWLLLSLDRLEGMELNMTHESIAQLLGVRREGVTSAAGKLQEAGVINCSRGRITVLNRFALESRVCECYGVVSREYQRLLPRLGAPRLQAINNG